MRNGLVAVGVSVLLLSACGRREAKESHERNREQPAAAAVSSAPTVPAITNVASGAEPPVVSRPSPFAPEPQASREQAAPQPTGAAKARGSEAARQPLKAFELSSITPRDKMTPLPPPPALPAGGTHAAAIPGLGERPCCLGTATAEPAKPARLERVLRKIPGLRRLHGSPDTEQGFVAPRPAHRIVMVLPPEVRAVVGEGTMDLKATVDESGNVTRVELLSPKDEELVRLASYAASDWRFVPARLHDKTVESDVILHFSF